MTILAIDRSTETQSAAVSQEGQIVAAGVLSGLGARSGEWVVKVRDFLSSHSFSFEDIDVLLVGQGPGSFAGIRASLAFAQGLALPVGKKVVGLPSSVALASSGLRAVIGDARAGRYWVIVYDGYSKVKDFTLVAKEELVSAIPSEATVVTPDGARIGELLASIFGDRYIGALVPLAENLLKAALANPSSVVEEPLPVYLSPAVRT